MGCGSSAVKQDRGAAAQHVPTLCFRGVVHSGSSCKWSFSVLIVSSEGITPVLLVDGSPVKSVDSVQGHGISELRGWLYEHCRSLPFMGEMISSNWTAVAQVFIAIVLIIV